MMEIIQIVLATNLFVTFPMTFDIHRKMEKDRRFKDKDRGDRHWRASLALPP